MKTTYISTDLKNFKRLGEDNVYFDSYGYGWIFWKEILPNIYVGYEGLDKLPYGTESTASNDLKGYTICTEVDYSDRPKKRFNALNYWKFEEERFGIENLEKFMDNHEFVFLDKINGDAQKLLLGRYRIELPVYHASDPDSTMEDYEKFANRYVSSYKVYGVPKTGHTLDTFMVEWYDRDGIEFIENNFDKFINIGDYTVVETL